MIVTEEHVATVLGHCSKEEGDGEKGEEGKGEEEGKEAEGSRIKGMEMRGISLLFLMTQVCV